MFERAFAPKPFPLPLRLDSGHRVLTPQGDAILGWLGGANAGAAEPVIVPEHLLQPQPASRIVYACNLPLLEDSPAGVFDVCGDLPAEIGRELEQGFLAASLPGGQTAVVSPGGEAVTVQFRWARLTAHVSIGAVWRCFVRTSGRSTGPWRAIPHDYIFEAGGGAVVNPPGGLTLPGCGAGATLLHPADRLTSFPCSLGRVKITQLAPDGWPSRRVLSVVMQDDNRIVAFFSDGRSDMIATAAPSSTRAARAAA